MFKDVEVTLQEIPVEIRTGKRAQAGSNPTPPQEMSWPPDHPLVTGLETGTRWLRSNSITNQWFPVSFIAHHYFLTPLTQHPPIDFRKDPAPVEAW